MEARLEQANRDEAYRFYVTRSLQLVPQNKYISTSFDELLKPKKVDNRTGDEIAADIIRRAGLKVGD